MFYRRKVLLGLLESLRRAVPRTDMQKLLFLISQEQDSASYDFVPYRFGCFSFQAEADKRTLTKYKIVRDTESWDLGKSSGYLEMLKLGDQQAISKVLRKTRRLTGKNLVRFIYENYPYYAINSEIAGDVLSAERLESVEKARPVGNSPCLFTIGYEGRSLERYLNVLIAQNVRVLCDVRRNPVSMKFGFSKRQLATAINGLGMTYFHMPELGIESNKRRALKSAKDYKELFDEYDQQTLAENESSLDAIRKLVRRHRRVALTCFEADHDFCHRGRIAQVLANQVGWRHKIAHL